MSRFLGRDEKVRVRPSGEFYCPGCRQTVVCLAVERVKITRFLFLPIKREVECTEMVKCGLCGGVFESHVATHSPEISRKGLAPALITAMMAMMEAHGDAEETELELISRIASELGGEPVYPQTLKREARSGLSAKAMDEKLRSVAPYLNNAEKRLILESALRVAHADGEVAEEEMALLHRMAALIDAPDTLFRRLLAPCEATVASSEDFE